MQNKTSNPWTNLSNIVDQTTNDFG